MADQDSNHARMKSLATTNFAERVQDRSVGACRLLTLQTPVDEFVSWRGSFVTNPDLEAGDDLRQNLMVSMLDKGTTKRDRFELARVLEDRGANLNLSSDGLYVDFSGQALRDDVPAVLDVLAEMLNEPQFDEAEFQKAKAQMAAQLQRQMESTGARASIALSQQLFPAAHPNHSAAPEAQLAALERLSLASIQDYHTRHIGANGFTLVAVGDLDHDAFAGAVETNFAAWPEHGTEPSHATEGRTYEPGQSVVSMPDKSNIDVRMGHPLSMRRGDEDYLALYVGNYILGGNFSARLMATVRDEKGLTYGIGSGLSGVTTQYNGYWQTSVTLSQDKLDEGLAATRNVIEQFVEEGATEDELAGKKTTITGSFKVGLATTKQLAQSLLTNAERGFDTAYLDNFPTLINDLSLHEVNEAVRAHLHPDRVHRAMAGAVPEQAPADAS